MFYGDYLYNRKLTLEEKLHHKKTWREMLANKINATTLSNPGTDQNS